MRVQIPAKAKFAPTCVCNSLLSELSRECITYLLCVGFGYVANWFVYIGKNPRFTAFLDSNLHTRLAIVTANELGLAFPPRNLPKKIRPEPSTFYLVIVVTNRQTDRQTNAGDYIIPRESFRGDNNRCIYETCVVPPAGRKVKEKYTDIADRSLTCHTATGPHMPHRITQCYLPPGRGDIPAFIPAETGTRLSDPGGRGARLSC